VFSDVRPDVALLIILETTTVASGGRISSAARARAAKVSQGFMNVT
jgi:hypothetical protein